MADKTKPFFEEVDLNINFAEMEKKILAKWYRNGIVKKYFQKNKGSKKYFSFLDGPITANNPMGVHHAWGRTYKDLYQRYKNMRGYKQRFQNGFDCQGLWVEVEVEKELGIKSKKSIENLVHGNKKDSIARFVELCKERVKKYAAIQTEQSKRLGYFMDWDNSYFTMSDDNNYMIWQFLKKCYEKGLIYKGRDSVPWCPRCGTAISQHEILTEDYKEVTHESIYLRLPIMGTKGEFLLVWTTTPWTLPANIAVAVDPKLDYALVKDSKHNKYWVAKDLVDKVFVKDRLEIIKIKKGKDLVGLKYNFPFDDLPAVKQIKIENPNNFHSVVATDNLIMPISRDEGTGFVHTATGAGTEDFQLGKKLSLPVLAVIEEDASYMKGFGFLTGKNAKDNPRLILDYLEKLKFSSTQISNKQGINYVFRIENYRHRYPACWRCKTELVWRVVDEWYIAIDPVRDDMKRIARKITWIPKFGLKRELDWLSNMHDWLISKKRYWGLALPIWECEKCNTFEVIGSRGELKERAILGWDKFEGHSPHRPWIDEIKLSCKKCGLPMTRIPDVGNPWLDAGIVPYSTISQDNRGKPLYWQNKKEWLKWFPADFITESFPGQFKNWFYSMIAMSTVLEGREPFKTVLGFATLLGEDGRPMHKSWGNAIEFNSGADEIGVDVMRWVFISQNPSENLLFGYKLAQEVRRKFHLKLWNVYNFFVTYANIDGYKPSKYSESRILNHKQKNVLDRWILSRFSEMYVEVVKYLDKYETHKAAAEIENFVNDLSNWYIRRSRDRLGPWPEKKGSKIGFYQTTYFILTNLSKILAPFSPFISEHIYTNLTKQKSVHLTDWPVNKTKIDKNIILDMHNLRLVVENAHSLRKEKNIRVKQPLALLTSTLPFKIPAKDLRYLLEDELNVKKWIVKRGKKLKSKFDTKITPALEEEARTRELIRKIQLERKKLKINLTQFIEVINPWLPSDKNLVQKIKYRTGARDIKKGDFMVKISQK